MEKIERNFGLCPVCGEGHIIKNPLAELINR